MNPFNVSPDDYGCRIEKFLAKNSLGFSLSQKLIRKKQVLINDQIAKIGKKLSEGDIIKVKSDIKSPNNEKPKSRHVSKENIAKITTNIIYQDENIIAINKLSGIATQGGSNIKFSVESALPYLKFGEEQTPRLVHRLDKDTSGILLIAKNRKIADILSEKFKNRQIQKTYLALIKGIPSQKTGEINLSLIKRYQGKNEKIYVDENGKEAITKYQVLDSKALDKDSLNNNISLIKLTPITGRTHQLRVHCKEIGHPILGDHKYSHDKSHNFPRLSLHSYKIKILDFFDKDLLIESEVPDFISKTFQKLTYSLK
jgi:23S rRNA pseudouridine955/2504/2580 synthase